MLLCGQCNKTFLFDNGWCQRCHRITRIDKTPTPVVATDDTPNVEQQAPSEYVGEVDDET